MPMSLSPNGPSRASGPPLRPASIAKFRPLDRKFTSDFVVRMYRRIPFDHHGASGDSPLVMMVQTTDFGHLDDFAGRGRLYSSRLRSVLPQRQMSSPVTVIGAIRRKRATKRSFAEDNEVVQTLAANRANGSRTPQNCKLLPQGDVLQPKLRRAFEPRG
jgi:hypothetical protein